MIYVYALGSRQIHISVKFESLEDLKSSKLRHTSTFDSVMTESYRLPATIEPISQTYLVCRRFYLETRSMPYSLNLFSFWDPFAFLCWKHDTQLVYINSIQRLTIPHYFSGMMKTEELVNLWKSLKTVYFSCCSRLRDCYSDTILNAPLNDAEKYWKSRGVEMVYLKEVS